MSNVELAAPSRTEAGSERRIARLETETAEDGHVFHLYVATHLPGRLEVVGIIASNAELFGAAAPSGPDLVELMASKRARSRHGETQT